MTRASLTFAAAVSMVVALVAPADAAQSKVVNGFVQYWGVGSFDHIQYAQSGCAQDDPNGTFAAFIDVRGFKTIVVQAGGADISPLGLSPTFTAKLYAECELRGQTLTQVCTTGNGQSCLLTSRGEQFLAVVIGEFSPPTYMGAHFTVRLYTA